MAVRLCDINDMLADFLAPDNNPMTDNKFCNILYCMVKHEWRDALRKSSCAPMDMSITNLVDYFKQIKLLEVVDKK
eukprot:5495149-Ditylum_brightwellii.AAC.1